MKYDLDNLSPSQMSYELGEALSELERHHKDFKRISAVIEKAFVSANQMTYRQEQAPIFAGALREIRGIVG